jgi:hypothetical protein
MSDKIKRLAKNVTGLLTNTETPQDTYYSLVHLMKKQKDYFQYLPAENILKLTFYCYSLGHTDSFELSDKMLNQIGFAVLFNNSGNKHTEYCDECGGNGDNECEDCDGSGTVDCGECEGSGDKPCDECNGTGEIEDNGEMVTCSECGGDETVSCDNCNGGGTVECESCYNGRVTCNTCDGNGEVDTDDNEYERFFIVTWNKSIKDRCEYTELDTDITMSEYDFDKLRDDEYIKLKIEESHLEFADWVEVNEIYCSYYNDNPKMFLDSEMYLNTREDNMKAYIKR